MDTRGKILDYSNMKAIPIYALYGEAQPNEQQEWLHWETIQSRSRLHDYTIAPHRHAQFFQVLYLKGGTARVVIDNEINDLAAPAVIVIPALTVHGYSFSRDVEGLVLTLLERDVRPAFGPELGAMVLVRDLGEVVDYVERLIAEAEHPRAGHGQAMQGLIALLAVAVRRTQIQAAVTAGASPNDRSFQHGQAFLRLIQERYRETRAIADYAQALGISATHLNRISRQVLGASALSVIERRIALEARRHLRFSSMTIKQVGAELGYDDPAYFTRFLTRHLGMPPGRFRLLARQAETANLPAGQIDRPASAE
jgi:AraC family transcriptional activator of pobA